jgi:hypothetical protein
MTGTEDASPRADGIEITIELARLVAGELADIVRQRLADYTPVTNGHQAVVLAYTQRVYEALAELADLTGTSISAITAKLDAEVNAARDAGFWVDVSIARPPVQPDRAA